METITQEGTTWTASTWAYNTPKLLFDGKRVYAVGLVGGGPDRDVARLYWREKDWHKGADITPVYQPATILLDSKGHINLFCTDRGQRAYHWRSVRAGDVTQFEQIELRESEKFGYGYLGAGRRGEMMVLAGLDNRYAMWLAIRPSLSRPWEKPRLLAPSQREQAPWQCPLYPVVMPDGRRVHVVYSNCPDGSVHNTYNRVEHALFDVRQGRVARRDIIAEGPVGEMTYGLDALQGPDGTIFVLYMAGVYAYGQKRKDIDQRRGLYCAVLHPGKEWKSHPITTSTGTGQLYRDPGGRLHVFESTSTGTRHYWSADQGQTWKSSDGEMAWSRVGYFLYIIKPNSGSMADGKMRAIQSTVLTRPPSGSDSRYGLDYIEMSIQESRYQLPSSFTPDPSAPPTRNNGPENGGPFPPRR